MKNRITSPLFAIFILSLLFITCKVKENKKQPVVTGYISAGELKNEVRFPWFTEGYNSYNPDSYIINELKKSDKNIYILVFAGDWCSDTYYLLPQFYKTTDLAGIANHQLYFLDRNKKSQDGLENNYKIELVPTFIIIKNGEETGRIEETVDESIEKDLLKIISKK